MDPEVGTDSFTHLFEPGAPGGTGPVLLLLHGTGGTERDLVPLGKALLPGAAIISPRGKVLEGGVAARFFRRHGEGVLDLDDLKERTDELADFVRSASVTYGFESSDLVAIGFSNGANIATGLLLRHPLLLRGAALLRPMFPYRPDPLPDLTGKSVLIAAGGGDPMVPPEQPRELAEMLAEAGATVEATLTPGAGHGLSGSDLSALTTWIETLRE